MYLARHLAVPLHRACALGGPVLLQGPRGAGKTTLLRREFPGHRYLDLSDSAVRREARRDPALFLQSLRRETILDESQRAPELWKAAESLLGLPVIFATCVQAITSLPTFTLFPATRAERARRAALPLSVLGRYASAPARGRAAAAPAWPWSMAFVERDLPSLVQIQDRERFELFLEAVARLSGEVLRQQDLARAAGVSHRSAVRWLEVLEACFQITLLPPFDKGFGRRQIRAPKLHAWFATGFETEAVRELYANAKHAASDAGFFHWRDSNGFEAPLVITDEGGTIPVVFGGRAGAEERLQRWMQLAETPYGALVTERPLPSVGSRGVARYALAQL
jgi:uncharacterized protein